MKSELISVNASERRLPSVKTSQPEVCRELLLSFFNGSALTAVYYSAIREPRFVPCNGSSDRVDALSALLTCPPRHLIEAHIEKVLEDKKSDSIGAFSSSIQNLVRNFWGIRIQGTFEALQNQAFDIDDNRLNFKTVTQC